MLGYNKVLEHFKNTYSQKLVFVVLVVQIIEMQS